MSKWGKVEIKVEIETEAFQSPTTTHQSLD